MNVVFVIVLSILINKQVYVRFILILKWMHIDNIHVSNFQ